MGEGITESQNSQIAGYFRSRDSWAVSWGDGQAPPLIGRRHVLSIWGRSRPQLGLGKPPRSETRCIHTDLISRADS